jgi:hypothetical protein
MSVLYPPPMHRLTGCHHGVGGVEATSQFQGILVERADVLTATILDIYLGDLFIAITENQRIYVCEHLLLRYIRNITTNCVSDRPYHLLY